MVEVTVTVTLEQHPDRSNRDKAVALATTYLATKCDTFGPNPTINDMTARKTARGDRDPVADSYGFGQVELTYETDDPTAEQTLAHSDPNINLTIHD